MILTLVYLNLYAVQPHKKKELCTIVYATDSHDFMLCNLCAADSYSHSTGLPHIGYLRKGYTIVTVLKCSTRMPQVSEKRLIIEWFLDRLNEDWEDSKNKRLMGFFKKQVGEGMKSLLNAAEAEG